MDETYRSQVRLLLDVLPIIAEEKDLALKGGTAINLFVRNLPRLSVDIDLTYLPIDHRGAAFAPNFANRRISLIGQFRLPQASNHDPPLRVRTGPSGPYRRGC